MNYKKCIKIVVPILISITIFLTILISVLNAQKTKEIETNEESITSNIQELEVNVDNVEQEEVQKVNINENWKIEIPALSVSAEISEGTDKKTLDKYVGHFSTTPKEQGNIGLAAHNRGYFVNYFQNLKDLKGGEEIIYTYGKFTKTYVVTLNIKIKDTDWSYLENFDQNKITLITCVENEPEYRRCVQAIEKEE